MKEQKVERQGLTREGRDPLEAYGKPQRPPSMIQTDVQMRKHRGRLSRHVQNKLGETLHAMFDEIVREGVPDRFSRLLDQIEESKRLQAVRAPDQGERFPSDVDTAARNPDPLVRPQRQDQAFPKSEDKGSS
jgi:hypothetical protein